MGSVEDEYRFWRATGGLVGAAVVILLGAE